MEDSNPKMKQTFGDNLVPHLTNEIFVDMIGWEQDDQFTFR